MSALAQVMAWRCMGQAITWSNVYPSLRRHMPPLGKNVLNIFLFLYDKNTGVDLKQLNELLIFHYSDVTMGVMTSQITTLTQTKENIKAPRHWPLCGEYTGDRWIPGTKGQ